MFSIHSIETFGTYDGPGIRMVIFLQGCNFRCIYCQNPDSISIKGGTSMTVEEIMQKLLREKSYITPRGGVTVSGGEPTLQTPELIKLFQACRKEGIHTALDTNGAIITSDVETLYQLTDLLLLDIKHIDNSEHIKLTKQPNKNPLKMAHLREAQQLPTWLRYVLVPGWNDQSDVLHRFGQYFKDFTSIERTQILPYHTLGVHKYQELGIPYELEGVAPPTKESIQQAQNILSTYLTNVTIR